MTPQQMVRAQRRWRISLVYDVADKLWYAGDCTNLQVNADNPAGEGQHAGVRMEDAVEDYCNARGLEWDT